MTDNRHHWAKRLFLWLTIVLSIPISFVLEFGTRWGTPGLFLARQIVNPQGLRDFGPVMLTAITVDATLLCGMVKGIRILARRWIMLRAEAAQGLRPTDCWRVQRAKVLLGAMLFALPLSYYIVLAGSWCIYGWGLPESALFLAPLFVVSLAACFGCVYGLYELAVRVSLGRALPKTGVNK
jgi:hypothetical protein